MLMINPTFPSLFMDLCRPASEILVSSLSSVFVRSIDVNTSLIDFVVFSAKFFQY